MRKLSLILLILCLLPSFARGQAAHAYITPSGTATGACPAGTGTAPNFTVAQAQNSANYGTGAGQIGPDTIVLWCGGTFTTAQNTNLFTEPGSGTTGHNIVFNFDTNTVLQSPQFTVSGGVIINGNNVTWDGGFNLTVQNTLNGTNGGACLAGPCTITTGSVGILVGGTNVIVERTKVTHIAVHTAMVGTDAGALGATTGIQANTSSGGNTLVTNNFVDNVRSGIGGGGGAEVSFNTVTFCEHCIVYGINQGQGSWPNIKIHNNDISSQSNWDNCDNTYHHNAIMMFTAGSDTATTMPGMQIYYNYVHGIMSNDTCRGLSDITSTLFLNNAGGSNNPFPNAVIARNIFALDKTVPLNNLGNAALESGGCLVSCTDNSIVANNTVVLLGFCWLTTNSTDGNSMFSNLCETTGGAILQKPITIPYPSAQVDGNIYPAVGPINAFAVGTTGCGNPSCNINGWDVWHASPYLMDIHCTPGPVPPGTGNNCGPTSSPASTHPTIADMNLNTTTWRLGAGSVGIGAAKNLTSLCGSYPFLCQGAPSTFGVNSTNDGAVLPASGNWDTGAYPFSAASGSASFVPSTLNFGQINKGASSAPVNNSLFTMTGTGTATFSSEVFSGPNAADFSLSTNGCNFPTGSVSAPGTCSVAIVFSPTAAVGTVETATFTANYSGLTGSPATITLTGISGATANLGVTFMGD